ALHPLGFGRHVVIGKQDDMAACGSNACVARVRQPLVPFVEIPRPWESARELLDNTFCCVARIVIYDQYFPGKLGTRHLCTQCRERPPQRLATVVCANHDRCIDLTRWLLNGVCNRRHVSHIGRAAKPVIFMVRLRRGVQRNDILSSASFESSTSIARMNFFRRPNTSAPRALNWFRGHMVPGQGIIVHTKQPVPYAEVTGYFVPTLYEWGETDLARTCIRWLASIQLAEGAFPAPDGVPYSFDTAQVIRGLCAAVEHGEDVRAPLHKACEWLASRVDDEGRITTPSTALWGDIASDLIHSYAIHP